MEIQIIDVDYVMVNDKPIIRIFGKNVKGESVCAFYEDFLSYFYVRGKKGAELMKSEAVKIENVKRKDISDNKESKDFYKIITSNPSKTPEYREMLTKEGVSVFEADILFKYRFMNDYNLKGMRWIRLKGNEISTNTVRAKKIFKIDSFEEIEKEDVPLKTVALDIECIPDTGTGLPDAKRDPIIMMSLSFDPTPYKGNKDMVLATRPGKGVQFYESEEEMLEGFIEIINDFDPDMLTGFNCNNFDFPYILERMRQRNIKPLFGRCNTKSVFDRKIGISHKISITGRFILDSFEVIKKDFSLQRYGLDFVSRKLLNSKKEDVKHSEIGTLWKGSDESYCKLIEYSRIDAVLAMDLVIKLKLLDKYLALSKVSGTLIQDTIEGGETTKIEHYLLREFNNEGYVMQCRPDQRTVMERDKMKKKELVGGYVIEPEKGLHKNVVVLDFASMYPSIIRTFNICPTTIVEKGGVKSPSGAMFVTKDIKQGIVPRILENLINQRKAVKKVMKKETDEEKKRVLYAKQWAIKILANAFYGYLGYSRAKTYNLGVANSITSYGRNIIAKTAEKIEKDFGYKIVYGDTDSVFVLVTENDLDIVAEKATTMANAITEHLPGVMALEFEKAFKRFLPLSKKRYIGWCFTPVKNGWEESMLMKGIETVRRDWCNLVGDTIKEIIDILLKKDDIKGALKCFRETIEKLNRGEISINKLVITKTMTKSTKSYMGMQPHIELVKKIRARSPEDSPGIGDRIPYIITKGIDILSKRSEDPNYAVEHGMQIDSQYYIENQLLPPMERIFSSLKISKSELLGNGKQLGLMDILKKPETCKPKSEPKITLSDMKGFICEDCNAFYPHAPLLGHCKCGGKIKFSSPKGQAGTVLIN